MSSSAAFNFAVFVVILTYNVVFPVKGQCTVQGCENLDSSINIVADMQQLKVEIFGELSKQVQGISEILHASFQQIKNLNESLQQMKNQQYFVMTSLRAVDQRSQEQDVYIKQVQSIHELLNASFQQMKNQNNVVMTSLQANDRRSQGQVQSIHKLLNASFQQMKNQHASAVRRLDVVIQLLLYHDNSIKNQTQNSWKLTIGGVPVQLDIDTDLGDGLALLPTENNWTIIMHRFDGSVDFNRNWTEYRNGFGDKERGEFWLGNEIVHRLTNRVGTVYTLRIEVQLKSNGTWYYADYATFSIDSEDNKYALHLSGYSGNASDALANASRSSVDEHGRMNFTTWDSDNDICSGGNCAQYNEGGWWFNCCYYACLTCKSLSFCWYSLSLSPGGQVPLRAARMMIKRK